MNPSRSDLTEALVNEWERLCHECPEEDDDTPEEFRQYLDTLTYDELVKEADCEDEYLTLEEFVYCNT